MKERPERKVIFEITGDGLTAEEVGRIRQVKDTLIIKEDDARRRACFIDTISPKERRSNKMSLVDAFAKEDRTEVKFSQFFALVKQAAQYETVMNAVNCDVPHRFIRETMTGKKEEVPEIPEKKEAVLGVVKVDFDAEEFRKTLQEVTAEIKAKFGPEEDEAEQEQEAQVKEPPEITAESILAAAEETTLAAAEETTLAAAEKTTRRR